MVHHILTKLVLLTVVLSSSYLNGQYFENYKNIQSSGIIPADFVTRSSEKFQTDLNEEKNSSNGNSNFHAKKEFLLISSFQVREMLFSGKIMFNDTISQYIKNVSDKLLEHDPVLRNQIRFYVYKSSAVNGFATNDGMIFITLGLLSRLKTEAELAFVLAHEITHYKKKHVINAFIKKKKEERSWDRVSRKDVEIEVNKYSRKLESEADLEGFKLFRESDYDINGIEEIFDVLKFYHLFFADDKFDTHQFEDENYKFPGSYHLKDTDVNLTPSALKSDNRTHPAPEERKKIIKEKIDYWKHSDKGSKFLVADKGYHSFILDVARFEIAQILLYEGEYNRCIYHCDLLIKKYPKSSYLAEISSLAFYYLFKSRIESKFTKDLEEEEVDYDLIKGEYYKLRHLFREMNNKELGILALKIATQNKSKFPGINKFKDIAFDLMYLLSRDYDIELSSFSIKPKSGTQPVIISRKDSVIKAGQAQANYFKYAFVNEMKDSLFSIDFVNAAKVAKQSNVLFDLRQDNKQNAKKREKRIKKHGHSFGVDKLVVVDPSYTKVDETKEQSLRYNASENALIDLGERMENQAEKADLLIEVLADVNINSKDLIKYNQFVFLRNWISHSIQFIDKADTSFFVSIEEGKKKELIEGYGTQFFCWTGFLGVKEKKTGKLGALILSGLIPYFLPLGIHYAVTPKHLTNYYMLTLDLDRTKVVWLNYGELNDKDKKRVIDAILFDTFAQLKRK